MISKKNEIAISILINLIAIITAFYLAYNVKHIGYSNIYLLPLIFGFLYVTLLSKVRRNLNNIFIHVFLVVSFTRYIILPFLIVFTGYYGGRSSSPPLESSFNTAIYLMSYEIIIVSVFLYLIFNKFRGRNNKLSKPPNLPYSYFIYSCFILFSILLGFIFPESFRSFAFLRVPKNLLDLGDSSTLVSLVTYCLVISKFLLFVIILSVLYKMNKRTNSTIYIILAFLAFLLNISIFFGDNRSDFIITTIAALLLFYKLFPQTIKYTLWPIGIIFIVILSSLNDHRNNVSVTSGEDSLVDLTGNLQIYLAGPYNVAIAIEAAENYDSKTVHLLHEILRPVMGLNLFLKDLDIKPSSSFFNERIFFSDHVSQIIPMIGQGFFYLGFLLAPLISVLYLLLAKFLISYRENSFRIEIMFFFSISLARLGFLTVQNGSILANDTSFFLLLFLIIYYLNNKIVLRKHNAFQTFI